MRASLWLHSCSRANQSALVAGNESVLRDQIPQDSDQKQGKCGEVVDEEWLVTENKVQERRALACGGETCWAVAYKLCKTSIIQQLDKASSSSSVRVLTIPFVVPSFKVTEDDNGSRSARNGRDGLTQAREED